MSKTRLVRVVAIISIVNIVAFNSYFAQAGESIVVDKTTVATKLDDKAKRKRLVTPLFTSCKPYCFTLDNRKIITDDGCYN